MNKTKETVKTPIDGEEGTVLANEAIDWNDLDVSDETADEVDVEDLETEAEEVDTDGDTEPNVPDDDSIDFDIIHLGKSKKIKSKEELRRLAQKGFDYDFVKQRAEKLAEIERENSELKIKLAEQELTQQKNLLKKELEADGYGDEVISKIDNHPAIAKAQEVLNEARAEANKVMLLSRRAAEKDALKSEPFFKEIEPEIDKMLLMPANAGVSVETIYEFLLGKMTRNGKLNEIKANTRKAVISEMADKAKRGTPHVTSDSASQEAVNVDRDIDSTILSLTEMFGNKISDIKKYMAKEMKNKKKG